jgi:hypothetical protein
MPESDARPPENRGRNRGGLPPVETRWRKGQSGNPGGRPKKKPITEAYEAMATSKVPIAVLESLQRAGFEGRTWAEAWAFGLAVKAARGDVPAAKEIADRVEGKPPTSEDEEVNKGPLYVVFHAPRPNREEFERELRLKREAIAVKALPAAE